MKLLPADVRRRLHLDEQGAQLEMTERADGVIELRAALPVPAEQCIGAAGAVLSFERVTGAWSRSIGNRIT